MLPFLDSPPSNSLRGCSRPKVGCLENGDCGGGGAGCSISLCWISGPRANHECTLSRNQTNVLSWEKIALSLTGWSWCTCRPVMRGRIFPRFSMRRWSEGISVTVERIRRANLWIRLLKGRRRRWIGARHVIGVRNATWRIHFPACQRRS